MNAQELFELYQGIRTHFHSRTYDWKKYHGKLKRKFQSVTKQSNRYFYEKVSARLNNREEAIGFLVSNFLKDKNFWIGSHTAFENFEHWQARVANLDRTISEDVSILKETMYNRSVDFERLIEVNVSHQHPALLRLYLSEMITPESATMLIIGLKLDQRWSTTRLSSDVLFQQEVPKLSKYASFLDIPYLLKKHESQICDVININVPIRVNPV